MTDVFISYSRRDAAFVRKLHEAIAAIERETWVDWEDIPLTSDWWSEICSGIDGSDSVVFIVSPDSLVSPICQLEVNYAQRHNKRLIPVVLREPDLSDTLGKLAAKPLDENAQRLLGGEDIIRIARDNWQEISRHHWLFFDDEATFDDSFQKLVSAIDTDLDHVREHTRLLVRAQEWEIKGRQESFLLSGAELAEAESWLVQSEGKSPSPALLHNAYISSSRQRETRRQRTLLGGVSVALVVAIALAVLSFFLFQDSQSNLSLAEKRGTESAANAIEAQQNAEIAENNASTATFALGEAEVRGTQVAAQATISAENLNQALDTQTLFLADLSRQQSEGGNGRLAKLLALEGLQYYPDIYHSENLVALQDAVNIPATEILRMDFYDGTEYYSLTADVSPDRRYVATGDQQGIIQIWEVETGAVLHTMRHADQVYEIKWNSDGTRLLTGSRDNTMRIWDAQTGKAIHTLIHDGGISEIYWIQNDSRVIGKLIGPYSVLWDAETGKEIARLTQPDTEASFSRIEISDGERYARVSSGDIATTWDLLTLQPVSGLLILETLGFNNGQDRAYTTPDDDMWMLIDANTGSEIAELGHDSVMNMAVWSNSGRRLATVRDDNTVQVWNTDGEMIFEGSDATVNFSDGMPPIQYAAWSPDDRYLLTFPNSQTSRTLSPDARAIIWELDDWFSPRVVPMPETAEITVPSSVTWSDNGRFVAIWGLTRDGSNILGFASVYETETGRIFPTMHHGRSVEGVEFITNETLLTWANDGTARIWDLRDNITLTVESSLSMQGFVYNDDRSRAVALRQQLSETLIQDGMAQMIDPTTGEVLFAMHHANPMQNFVWSPDFSKVLTWDTTGNIRVWDAKSGDLMLDVNEDRQVSTVRWNNTGQQFMSRTWYTNEEPHHAIVWDTESGERLFTLEHDAYVRDAFWVNDYTVILTYSSDQTIRLWSATDGSLLTSLEVEGTFGGLQLSQDELKILVWTNNPGTVNVYDINTGEVILALQHPTEEEFPNVRVTWSHDESMIIVTTSRNVSGATGEFYAFDAETGEFLYQQPTDYDILSAQFLTDNETMILHQREAASVHNLKTGELLFQVDHGPDSFVSAVLISPDETKFLTRWDSPRVWDMETGQLLFILRHDQVGGATWFSDSRRVWTYGRDGTIREWLVDVDELIEKTRVENMTQLDNAERAAFFLQAPADATPQAIAQAFTPTPTLTASPTLTPSPTIDLTLVTVTPTYTPTASRTPRFSVPPLTASAPEDIVRELAEYGLVTNTGTLAETIDQFVIDLSDSDNIVRWDFFDKTGYVDVVVGGELIYGNGALEDHCGIVVRAADRDNVQMVLLNRTRQVGTRVRSIMWNRVNGEWQRPLESLEIPVASPPDRTNQIVLTLQDGQIYLFIDGSFAGRFATVDFSDDVGTNYAVGVAGWTGENSDEMSCTFKNMWLWDLNAGETSPVGTATP